MYFITSNMKKVSTEVGITAYLQMNNNSRLSSNFDSFTQHICDVSDSCDYHMNLVFIMLETFEIFKDKNHFGC